MEEVGEDKGAPATAIIRIGKAMRMNEEKGRRRRMELIVDKLALSHQSMSCKFRRLYQSITLFP